MKLNRRNLIGGLVGSAALAGIPERLMAMGSDPLGIGAPRFRSARDVGPPHPNAQLAMHLILDAVGMARQISLYAARITKRNIAGFATTIRGERYVVYDREHVPWPDDVTPWTSVFLVAHEIGHHASSHGHRSDDREFRHELEADFFAGFAMNKLGASLDDTIRYNAGSRGATATHPASRASREAATRGWQQAERIKQRQLRQSMQTQGR